MQNFTKLFYPPAGAADDCYYPIKNSETYHYNSPISVTNVDSDNL